MAADLGPLLLQAGRLCAAHTARLGVQLLNSRAEQERWCVVREVLVKLVKKHSMLRWAEQKSLSSSYRMLDSTAQRRTWRPLVLFGHQGSALYAAGYST